MMVFDLEKYAACARRVAAEGCVLLKNDDGALPLSTGSPLAVFGRSQFNYYKSGTGSGGMVNAAYVVDIPQALENGGFHLDEGVRAAYEAWVNENPFDAGTGWAEEPWFQPEMPLDDKLVRDAAARCDTAIVVIGRTAGEDQDNRAERGSYLLTELEEQMLQKVCGAFKKSVVLLNVGNIIDMKWVEAYAPSAVLYVWQGGQEGGSGVLDVLTGAVTPCGKLADTIAADIRDYPSTAHYGDPDENIYHEDIYVGYRYFETFAPEKVLYPFGFGLSYTTFDMEPGSVRREGNTVTVTAAVTNTGRVRGREVVQIYVQKPQGVLGQPLRALCAYVKTAELEPGEKAEISCSFDRYSFASYDDSGCTGHKSCYVLEAGDYVFFVGGDIRAARPAGKLTVPELEVVCELEEIMAPTAAASRLHPEPLADGRVAPSERPMPVRSVPPLERRGERLPPEYPCTGSKGLKLADVRDGRASMEDFIAQLTDEELCQIIRGEGMCSPKVTPGTGGAFGGVTDALLGYGIPVACCTDGPSGIRMDTGMKAFSLPNGTAMACTFADDLIEELYTWVGLELRKDKVDVLLGPGMNIHRNPLNGRNFEYFSEEPLLSGKMAAAQLKGMRRYGVTGTLKHFACNNQEHRRHFANGVISERALREIYLKGFEIAVKEGGARFIMSTYGPVNGIYTSSNYDLLTTVLRGEWGFNGAVMTDWGARGNEEGQPGSRTYTSLMVRAQNDLYMVITDAASNSGRDDSMDGIRAGRVTRGEFQRAAANICRVIMDLPVFDRFLGAESDLDRELKACITEEDEALSNAEVVEIKEGHYEFDAAKLNTGAGRTNLFRVMTHPRGKYTLSVTCRSAAENPLAQIPLSVFQDKRLAGSISLMGADNEYRRFDMPLDPGFGGGYYLKFFFGQGGMDIGSLTLQLTEEVEGLI